MMKRQIVFVEPRLYHPTYKIARTLRLTGRYETVLICFNEVDKGFARKAFDKIITFKINFSLSPKNLFELFRKLTRKETYVFLKNIRKLKPYVINVRRSSLGSLICLLVSRKFPTIFNISDILQLPSRDQSVKFDKGKRALAVNALAEKLCIKVADGILNKSGEGSLNLLRYKIDTPVIDFLPYCLDEWIVDPKTKNIKKNKDIHLVYTGSLIYGEGHESFPNAINMLTCQGIHVHLYPANKIEEGLPKEFGKIIKNQEFLHYHDTKSPEDLNKEIKDYHYSVTLDFNGKSLFSVAGMGSKMFTSIEAGIPIIMDKECKNMLGVIERDKMGFGIDYEDLARLGELILKHKYPSLRDIKNAQKELNIKNQIHRLEEFYEKIHNLKHNNV